MIISKLSELLGKRLLASSLLEVLLISEGITRITKVLHKLNFFIFLKSLSLLFWLRNELLVQILLKLSQFFFQIRSVLVMDQTIPKLLKLVELKLTGHDTNLEAKVLLNKNENISKDSFY